MLNNNFQGVISTGLKGLFCFLKMTESQVLISNIDESSQERRCVKIQPLLVVTSRADYYKNVIVLTTMRRNDVASASVRRHSDSMCVLGKQSKTIYHDRLNTFSFINIHMYQFLLAKYG